MKPVDKLASDLERRAAALRGADAAAAIEDFRGFFVRSLRGVPGDVLDDVFSRFLDIRAGRGHRPAEAAGEWLASVSSLLSGDWDKKPFTPKEWKELGELVALGSDEMDLETLNYALALILENGGLS